MLSRIRLQRDEYIFVKARIVWPEDAKDPMHGYSRLIIVLLFCSIVNKTLGSKAELFVGF